MAIGASDSGDGPGSGLQALLFLRHTRDKTERETVIRNMPEVFSDFLAKTGLDLSGQHLFGTAHREQSADTQGQDYA
jgi:anti-anti-sigma regulatory factor